tara:strand:- start:307 stop:450 length:144 start_codon:yes stop_codon:yes gene_type:complete
MAHQSANGGFGTAYPVSFTPKPEQSPSKKEKEKDEEYESLEEALTGE